MKHATRDYRHGPSKRKPYQRRSQVESKPAVAEPKAGVKRLLIMVMALTLVLLSGYWIAQHFVTQGVKSESEKPSSKILSSEVAKAPKVTAQQQPQLAAQVAPIVVESMPVASVSSPKSIQYTFYQGLAETEVVVDAEPIPVKLADPYYIVAGTFGSEVVAQKELERLTTAQEAVSLSIFKTERYFRLRAGPFDDRLELNRKRNVLRSLGADTLLMRAKEE